jgi:hypothetical protein
MPYIRGRYYMNPVVGDALEAAREAEAALQALEHAAKVARGDTGDEDDSGESSSGADSGSANSSVGGNPNAAPGPIHRVEIEATELVPSHSGRAQRGFVTRVHRRAGNAASAPMQGSFSGNTNSSSAIANGNRNANAPAPASPLARNYAMPGAMQQGAMQPAPETHVFANHNDLTNFLRDQFANDCAK